MAVIRRAREDEIDLLAEEFWYPLAKMMEKYSDLNKLAEDAVEKSKDGFEEILQGDKHTVFILEDSDEKLGFMMLREEESPTREHGRSVKIVDLYIKEGHRSQGYGTELVKKAREYAREKNFDYIRVSSEWENHKAREFYEKKGFTKKQVEYVDKVS